MVECVENQELNRPGVGPEGVDFAVGGVGVGGEAEVGALVLGVEAEEGGEGRVVSES